MITGVHAVVFGSRPDELRGFFRDTLGLESVDAGGGWLIFALPPAELAVHPGDEPRHALYLMCDDLDATAAELEARGAAVSRPFGDERWGRVTAIALPGGGELGLYEPRHDTGLGRLR